MNQEISLGSDRANELGFTPDLFFGYLWETDDKLTVSLIESLCPGKGNFGKLLRRLLATGKIVSVPIPFARMKAILEAKGFQQVYEPAYDPNGEYIEHVGCWQRQGELL